MVCRVTGPATLAVTKLPSTRMCSCSSRCGDALPTVWACLIPYSILLSCTASARPLPLHAGSAAAARANTRAVVCAHCAARGLGDTVLSSDGNNTIISTSNRPPAANQSRPAEPICVRVCALLLLLLQEVCSHFGLATLTAKLQELTAALAAAVNNGKVQVGACCCD